MAESQLQCQVGGGDLETGVRLGAGQEQVWTCVLYL